jgi:hypothetical protein
MDYTVDLIWHRATLLSQIAICQVIFPAFSAAPAFFPPIGKMVFVLGGGLLSSAASYTSGADQLSV